MKVIEALKILAECEPDYDLHIVWVDPDNGAEVINEVEGIVSDDVSSVDIELGKEVS